VCVFCSATAFLAAATQRQLNHVEHTRVRHMPIMVPVVEEQQQNEIVLVNQNNNGANQNNGAA
jgi:hypothetical protein